MNISNLKSSDLRIVINLLSVREKLEKQLEEVNRKIEDALNGTLSGGEGDGSSGNKKIGRVRGALKLGIMKELEAAGERGVVVKEVAQAIGEIPQNVHVWFHNAKKTNPNIRKNDQGRWMLATPPATE